jgi:aryl-alcohol dehydrogenase-like predicted oxidoreductase
MPESAPTHATPAGTRRYAEKFPNCLTAGHFRQHAALHLSSLGIGTYLGEPDARTDAAYTEAVVAAVSAGVNVIDSAINYRFQRSERSVAAALPQLAALGFARDEILLCTKGGYLTPDGAMPPDPGRYFLEEYVQRGVLRVEDVAAGIHCMSPAYLQDQLARSLRNLGVSCIDVYYLHNPETQLSAVSPAEFCSRLRSAFLFLESAVNAGQIRSYGLATWNAFRVAPNLPEFISLEETVRLARDVAGAAHHFRFVQLPFNLAMPEAFAAANQSLNASMASMAEAAAALDITLIASASLLQSQLTRNLPLVISDVLGLDSDLLRALQFARSAPGMATALVGMSRRSHVEENLRLASVPPATPDQFRRLFAPSV